MLVPVDIKQVACGACLTGIMVVVIIVIHVDNLIIISVLPSLIILA